MFENCCVEFSVGLLRVLGELEACVKEAMNKLLPGFVLDVTNTSSIAK